MSDADAGRYAPDLEAAQAGSRYLVEWDDCCASGRFEAVLVTRTVSKDLDGSDFFESATFDNGATVSGHGVTAIPVTVQR